MISTTLSGDPENNPFAQILLKVQLVSQELKEPCKSW